MYMELNEKETESLGNFVNLCMKVESLKENGKNEKLSYEYIVTINTGLGCSVKVRCKELGLIEDITDYSSW